MSSAPRSPRAIRPAFAVFAAVFLASAAWTFTRTRLYAATAQLTCLFYPRTSGREVVATAIQSSQASVDQWVDAARSDEILKRAAARLPSWLRNPSSAGETEDRDSPERLRKELRVSSDSTGRLLLIAYRDRDAETAASTANAVAEAVNDHVKEIAQKSHVEALRFIDERVQAYRRNVAESTAALAQTPDDTGLQRELALNRGLLAQLESRFSQASAQAEPEIFSLHRATPPAASDSVSPKHLLNLSAGVVLGLLASLLTARLSRASSVPSSPPSDPSGH